MSNILTSGCGITFSGERPTWTKVLKLCGLNITDVSGPAISNQLIVNQLLTEVYKNKFDHVVCQLTSFGKLDVEINNKNKWLMENDKLRNFVYKKYWPSSHSQDHFIKANYHEYLYSPSLEEEDIIFKLLLLQEKCKQSNCKLHILQGYKINWTNKLIDQVKFNKDYIIYDDYKNSEYYKKHDFTNKNTVPNIGFQIYFAKHICNNILKIENNKLERFNA